MNNKFLKDAANTIISSFLPLNDDGSVGRTNMRMYGILFYNEFINANMPAIFILDINEEIYDRIEGVRFNIELELHRKADSLITRLSIRIGREIMEIYIRIGGFVIYASYSNAINMFDETRNFPNNRVDRELQYLYLLIDNFTDFFANLLDNEEYVEINRENGYYAYINLMNEVVFPMLQNVKKISSYCVDKLEDTYYLRVFKSSRHNRTSVDFSIQAHNDNSISIDISFDGDGGYFLGLDLTINYPYTINDISNTGMSVIHGEGSNGYDLTLLTNELIMNLKKPIQKRIYGTLGDEKMSDVEINTMIANYMSIGQGIKSYKHPSTVDEKEEKNLLESKNNYDYINEQTKLFLHELKDDMINLILDEEKYINRVIDEDCSICLEKMTHKDSVKLGCKHTYHNDCIRDWIAQRNTCPLDRRPIVLIIPNDVIVLFVYNYFTEYIKRILFPLFGSQQAGDFESYRSVIEHHINYRDIKIDIMVASDTDYTYTIFFIFKFESIIIYYNIIYFKQQNFIEADIRINDEEFDRGDYLIRLAAAGNLPNEM